MADFDKIYNFEGPENSERSKLQDLMHRIFRSPQYLFRKPKLALLDQQIPKKSSLNANFAIPQKV